MRKFRLSSIVSIAILAMLSTTLLAQDPEPKGTGEGGGGFSTSATGGPDAFGYRFTDQADGCPYQFIDISATGTFVLEGDDVAAPVTLALPITFYDQTLTQLAAASNGYLSTDQADAGTDLSNDCPLPAAPSTGSGGRIYSLHDDIYLEPGIGRLLTQFFTVCPRPSQVYSGVESCTIFQWDDAAHFPGGGGAPTFDFQTILYHTSNQIVFQIGPGNPELGSGSTSGIQNSTFTTGLTYACNTANSIPDNTAVCLFHPVLPPQPAAPAPSGDPPGDQAPLCRALDGSTNSIIRAQPPAGASPIYCRIITENSVYLRNPGEIGVQSVINLGVIQAVDLFNLTGDRTGGIRVCLEGRGGIIFLASEQAPRQPHRLESIVEGDYTCTTLLGTGTVVLVRD